MSVDDPGMVAKMAPPGLADLSRILAGQTVDERPITGLVAFVDARHDCADFRMVTLLTLWYRAGSMLSPATRDEVRRAILDFAYWMDEPGTDAMCTWSENHQIIFAACEYLAGQAFTDARFGSSGFTGRDRMRRARPRLDRWLADRFRFGYTEWSSTTYYEEHAAGLGLLVEHAADAALAARATAVLDLLFADLALHGFRGRLVTTSGRAYEQQKKYPETADVDQLMAWAFPAARQGLPPTSFDHSRISGPLLLGTRYRVPAAIAAIADQTEPVTFRTSTGLDVGEVASQYPRPPSIEDAGMQLWAMEAFTIPGAMNLTAEAIETYGMQHNAFLAPLAPFVRFRRTGLLPLLAKLLRPATRGVAIQRANITTWRSGHALLSSVQQYHPGDFGDQQHLWTLALPGDVAIFANHPGAPIFDNSQRGFSPAEWVGNGINPATGQDGPVLLACYDTRALPGLLEARPRQRLSHLFAPFERFDEWRLEDDRLWVRAGPGCALLVADGPIEQLGDELVRRGRVTGWAVVAAAEPCDRLADFIADAHGYRLHRRGGQLILTAPAGAPQWRLDRRQFSRDGVRIESEHPRFDTPWVRAERLPSVLEFQAGGHRLVLRPDGRATEAAS